MFLLYAFLIAVGGTVPYLHFGDNRNRISVVGIIGAFAANLIVALVIGYAIVPFLYGPFGGPAIVIVVFVFGLINSVIASAIIQRYTHGAIVYTIFMVIVLIQLIAGSTMLRAYSYRAMIGTTDDQDWIENINQVAPTNEADFATATLKLTRVSTEVVGTETLYYLYSENMPNLVFVATSDISPELPISQPPDLIQIRYLETNEPLVQLATFNNTQLNIRTTTEQ